MSFDSNLTDLIDLNTLQRIQDSFSNITGISAITTDNRGVILTKSSGFPNFCMKCTRVSELGSLRCERCSKLGINMAMKEGRSVVYTCHAGLMNFAAPIVVQSDLVGCIIAGQVSTKPLDLDNIREYAIEIGIDPDEYVREAKKIKIVTNKEIDTAAEFLYTQTDIISNITYSRYLVFQANEELGKTVHMRSNFLANMSHEIRTPMNAVIGMAEMALREELPTSARGYISQIKSTGKTLLKIINDILDFSKIESGRMDIIMEEYEPMSMLYDIASIIMTRLKDKNVEFIFDIPADLPCRLYGDSIRIKQVILNIANNAAKFTLKGKIILRLEYSWTSKQEIEMRVSVEDTGIGIKSEDIDKLFESFFQLDSKRNRNVEGTGLGLAISQRLLSLMNGNISVQSEYGKGSRFLVAIPQKVVNAAPSVMVKDPFSICAAGWMKKEYLMDELRKDTERLGVECVQVYSLEELNSLPRDKSIFLFIDESLFTTDVENFAKQNSEITVAVLTGFYSVAKSAAPNIIIVKKPLFILNIALLFNHEDPQLYQSDVESACFDFLAPDANVLIVDDNEVNLMVTEGLLEPLQMNITTAISGKEAINKAGIQHYDLIFMDHMMPEMDGIEATHLIREQYPEYNDIPIIALSANAIDRTAEMFRKSGLNDFIPKPIEVPVLLSKVKQWLPADKVKLIADSKDIKNRNQGQDIEIGDLDVEFAIRTLGSEKLFRNVLKEYYRVIDKKAQLIRTLEEKEDWRNYTIEVHALKSSSKQIGAMSLSQKAEAMEEAGNKEDGQLIHQYTGEMLEQYMDYIKILEPICSEEATTNTSGGAEGISVYILCKMFNNMRAAIASLDMDEMEEVIREMEQYAYEEKDLEIFARLKEAVNDIDVDACETVMQEWESQLH